MSSTDMSLIYVWDAYCGWCYGFSENIRKFHENHSEIPMKVLSGGLFVGNRIQPIHAFPHIPEANKRISQATGAKFGMSYHRLLQEGTFVMNSEAAAIGFAALRLLSPERAIYLASAMQNAFYQDGKSLSDPATYQEIAINHGLDGNAVLNLLKDPDILKDAREDFIKAVQLGARSYPTLYVKKDNDITELGVGAATLDEIEEQFAQIFNF